MTKAEAVDYDSSKGTDGSRWDSCQENQQSAAPELVIFECFEEMSFVESVSNRSSIIAFYSMDGKSSFIFCQALRGQWTVWS